MFPLQGYEKLRKCRERDRDERLAQENLRGQMPLGTKAQRN